MNWTGLYNVLEENNKLDEVIQHIENNQSYSLLKNQLLDFRRLGEGQTEGKVYDFESKIMFAVEFESTIISVAKNFLFNSLNSQKLKRDLENSMDYKFTFFDFQFIRSMVFAADISSGQTWFKNSIGEIISSLQHGKANLNGIEISTEEELIKWLRENLFGATNLSDEELKKRYA